MGIFRISLRKFESEILLQYGKALWNILTKQWGNLKYFKDTVADVGTHPCPSSLNITEPKADIQLPLFAIFPGISHW